MKTICRRICGVLLGLGVLGWIAPVVRGDEMADWMAEMRRQNEEYNRQWQQWREEQDRLNQQAQQEREARDRAYYEAQQEREARDRAYQQAQQEQEARDKAYYEAQAEQAARDKAYYEAQQEREASEKYYREQEAAQKVIDDWYRWNEETRQYWENQRKQEEWDKWSRNLWGDADWAASDSTAPSKPVVRRALAQRSVVILNSFALRRMVLQHQEKVRLRIKQMGQQITEGPQLILNPFVGPPK